LAVNILFFRDAGRIPTLDWLEANPNETAQDRCVAALERLAVLGHEARRPLVENLGSGIWELRVRVGRQNYRFL
jgi:hypothetical protein